MVTDQGDSKQLMTFKIKVLKNNIWSKIQRKITNLFREEKQSIITGVI